jgi:hypothetical protein
MRCQIGISRNKDGMTKANHAQMIPDELVMIKIYLIRGQKGMPDRDLAE